ncbi:MAG TPA: hypothetical protein VEF90_01030 [Xanthobacteraceae bacterium]|nr:hypothetical protein [Xanthobacteraceae bacterium]
MPETDIVSLSGGVLPQSPQIDVLLGRILVGHVAVRDSSDSVDRAKAKAVG